MDPQKRTNVRPMIPVWIPRITNALFRLSPRLGSRLFFEMFLRPPRHPTPARETVWMESVVPKRWVVKGREIVGWSLGQGPTILMVHGWAGRGSQLGAFVGPLVDRGFRVVGFDLPGHGESSGNRSSLPESRWVIEDLLRRNTPAHGILAHSMGGAVATAALADAGPVERLVYLGVSDDVIRSTRRAIQEFGFADQLYGRFQRIAEARFKTHFSDYQLALNAPTRSEKMLAIHADNDREVPLEEAKAWVSRWPGAALKVHPGLGHNRILHQPQVVAQAVEFLSQESPTVVRRTLLSSQASNLKAV